MATLCLLGDDDAMTEKWEIGLQPVTIGRGPTADVRIEDDGLSRQHFMILRDGEDFVLKDLSSRNGTWVEGDRAATARLRDNASIVAGRTRFRFSETGKAGATNPKRFTGPHDTVILPAGRTD